MAEQPDDRVRIELLQAMLDRSAEGVLFVDADGEVRLWNRAAEELLGLDHDEFANHPVLNRLIRCPSREYGKQAAVPLGHGIFSVSCNKGAENEGEIQVHTFVEPIEIQGRRWVMVCLRQGQMTQRAQKELYELARTDELSQLLNRRGFQAALEKNLHRRLALAIVDIDRFKTVNDSYGHEVGDRAIEWLGGRIDESFPNAIAIGRLGGDEFGVVLEVVDQNAVNQRFVAFCRDFGLQSVAWLPDGVTISVGVAIARTAGVSARELLSKADWAMYRSKELGRNRSTSLEI